MARVSTPQMPGRLWLFSQSSSGLAARQLAGSVMSPRSTTPRAAGVMRLDVLGVGADIADMRER